MPRSQAKDALSTRQKILFSTGDITSSLPLTIQMFFQLYFLTDVVRLSPGMAGWVLGITRGWDAVNDPIVGFLSDRIRSPVGRRRILLMAGSLPLGFFFALGWLVPPFSELGKAIYYGLVLIAFDTAFTIVHVGYNALTPELTFDYDERSSLNGYRMVSSLLGTLGALAFATLLDRNLTSETVRFAAIGVCLGAIAVVPPWIVAAITTERPPPANVPPQSLWMTLRGTMACRPFVLLMGIYLASWTSATILASMLVYYARYYLNVPDQANYFILLAQASAVAFVPVMVRVARTWDKPRAYIAGISYWCVVLVAIAVLGRVSLTTGYLLAMLCGPGIATAMVIPWSMVPDVIEADQLRSGLRREGAIYSLVAFFQKLGTGMGLWAVGQALMANGYVTPTATVPVPEQPAAVLMTIRCIIGPVTAGLLLLSLPIAWWYPIDRASHQRLLDKLEL